MVEDPIRQMLTRAAAHTPDHQIIKADIRPRARNSPDWIEGVRNGNHRGSLKIRAKSTLKQRTCLDRVARFLLRRYVKPIPGFLPPSFSFEEEMARFRLSSLSIYVNSLTPTAAPRTAPYPNLPPTVDPPAAPPPTILFLLSFFLFDPGAGKARRAILAVWHFFQGPFPRS